MRSATEDLTARARIRNALLACGLVAGPLFTAAWIVEGVTRTGYDPLRHPVSSLAIGPMGWTQVANFLVTGLLVLAFAVGLWQAVRPLGGSTWGPLLVAVAGLGLFGAGIFVADPLSGYPPGTPGVAERPSVHGALHQLLSALYFFGLPAACLVFARRFAGWQRQRWAIYSAATAGAFAAVFVLTSVAFAQNPSLVAFGGLFQRIAITTGWVWVSMLAVHVLTKPRG